MGRAARIVSFGIAALLVLAGIAAGVAIGGTIGQVLALALVSLGLVLATALVFLEIGLSEDRELEREQARSRADEHPPGWRRPRRSPPGRPRPRLDRMRGRPRRLR